MLSGRIAADALCVAIVVGTLLNGINQCAALFGGGAIAWGSVVLNFIVPYCVATYAAARNEARLLASDRDVRIPIVSRPMSREGDSEQHRGR